MYTVSSAGPKSARWMPNRTVRVEGAGYDELRVSLNLAFGGLPVTAYRFDNHTVAGDRLLMASDAKLLHQLTEHEYPAYTGVLGTVCAIPTMPVDKLVGFVEGFLAVCHRPPSPDCDGSVQDDAFLLWTLETYGDGVLVGLMANWREFHK